MDTAEQHPPSVFLDALRRLYDKAGQPSCRKIAEASGGEVSHATVHGVLRGRNVPAWRSARAIVSALGGDPDVYLDLWAVAHRPSWSPRSTQASPEGAFIEAVTTLTEALERLTRALSSVER